MARKTPRASPPLRHSQADFTGTPSETGDLTRVVSGVIGAERLHSWGVWSCTRAGTPLPAPPSRGMRVYDRLENVLMLEILAAVVPVREFLNAGNRRGNKCPLLAKTEPATCTPTFAKWEFSARVPVQSAQCLGVLRHWPSAG